VPPKVFTEKGCREPKNVERHCSRGFLDEKHILANGVWQTAHKIHLVNEVLKIAKILVKLRGSFSLKAMCCMRRWLLAWRTKFGEIHRRRQFHQHFQAHFLYKSRLSSFSLLRVLLWMNFRTKNAWVKCWWNWLQGWFHSYVKNSPIDQTTHFYVIIW